MIILSNKQLNSLLQRKATNSPASRSSGIGAPRGGFSHTPCVPVTTGGDIPDFNKPNKGRPFSGVWVDKDSNTLMFDATKADPSNSSESATIHYIGVHEGVPGARLSLRPGNLFFVAEAIEEPVEPETTT